MGDLPKIVLDILNSNEAPVLLQRHLTLVYNVEIEILNKFSIEWPNLKINKSEALFGAATHDIGKIIEKEELYNKGNKHEVVGYEFLINNNIDEKLARFAKTHGSWKDENLKIEDLLVTLADKIWKGSRINELEERITDLVSKSLDIEYWSVYTKLDTIISSIIIESDKRLAWQRG